MLLKIAVIGAGMAGIGAARALALAGATVILYEKSPGLGGRVATRRIDRCIVDHGAQILKPEGSELFDVMQKELPTDDLVEVTSAIRTYASDGSILAADPDRDSERKFTYRKGLTTLPKLLLQSLPQHRIIVRFNTRISAFEETKDSVLLRDADGGALDRVDAVVLTAPAPQSAEILAASTLPEGAGAHAVEALRGVPYHPCITILLGYAPPVPAPPAYALLAADRSCPLLWLAFEQTKAPERTPGGGAALIAQLGPEVSREQYAAPDAAVAALALAEMKPLFGRVYETPQWQQVKRWRYSQPRGMADFDEVNRKSIRTIVCGDALRPENGRVHQAYASGVEAAARVISQISGSRG